MAAARTSRVFNDEKPLQRSSSKVDAIRRGTLRISGPISTDTEIEDDVLAPDRSSVSLRIHEAVTEKRSQLLRDASPEPATASDVEGQNQQAADSLEPPRQRDRNSVALRDTTYSNGYASTYSHPYSMSADLNSVRVSPKDDAKRGSGRKAKGGSFRAAVRRLFGRKPKPVQSTPTRHGYHRSDPGALLRPSQTPQPSSTPQRSFSMPIRDITPSVALQSHSPAVQFPHSKELKPLNLRPTIRQHSPRRRATLGSTAPKGDNSTSLPKSFDDPFWDSIVPVEERDIGLAVTSGSNPKRRSRSAGALRDASRVQVESSGRRRSEEIRYWRASTDGRPMSGESRYSGIAFGASGPERKVNSMHYRDASDGHAQPASPRHGRIFDFRPMNEAEIEEAGQNSPDNGSGHKSAIGTPVPEVPEDNNRTLSQEPMDVSGSGKRQRQNLEEGSTEWAQSQSPSLHNFYDESSQDAASPRGSGPGSGTPNLASPNFKGHGQTPKLDPAPTLITSMPRGRPKSNAPGGSPFSGKHDVSRVDDTVAYQEEVHRTPEKTNEQFGHSYAEDYIGLIHRQLPPEMPSPLSPGTSTTFEAISNVLAHERAARKELERLVYELKREVAELRSTLERRTRLSAYGDRSAHDEMRTYRSHSSETMDARKTLDRLEGYGRHDDQRVTVIRSRFSGFDSVDDSNGGTADEDDRADDNDDDDDTRGQPASSGQEEQTREELEPIHHRSLSAPSTDIESPSSEAFETPREEASGYAYAYDADDDDVSRKPMHSVGARVPVVVGGMF
ncbi:MAG: hypothetical protein Q9165_002008 [Trypethelium subeluteriae]